MVDWVGWLATALVVGSYFFKRQVVLRRIQAVAALAWLTYGVLIHSGPVIVANVIVAAAALGSSFTRARQGAG
jgi:hypothetical protein